MFQLLRPCGGVGGGSGLKMGQMDQKWDCVQQLFFNFPQKVFGLRELSRLSKVPKSSLQRQLRTLVQEKIVRKKDANYIANETNFDYKFKKKNYLLAQIYHSGLVDFLQNGTFASVIILFGSGAKGEYVQKSDLDLFLLAREKPLDLSKFEKKLHRKINLLFKENLDSLSPELFNNIVNGSKLSGYLKIK